MAGTLVYACEIGLLDPQVNWYEAFNACRGATRDKRGREWSQFALPEWITRPQTRN